jgi:hypothetical protein
MTLRVVALPSLEEALERAFRPRDCSPMPVHLPAPEVVEAHLQGRRTVLPVVPYRRRRE